MSFCVLYWVVKVIYIYIFKVQIWKKKMYLLLTSYLCLNQNENIAYWCFLIFIPQLLTKILTFTFWSHVWRGNSRDCLCPQGFRDGKEIYIYTHTPTATECCGGYYEHVIFALNSGGLSREKTWALNLGDGVEFFLINY